MTGYLIRRTIQGVITVFLVALATYFLFSVAPGGPLAGVRQQQQRLTREDLARVSAQYELDLYWPVRFTRWLAGVPSGPIVFAGQEWFVNVPVGCYLPAGNGGCDDYVYLHEIPTIHPEARSSRGILRGDFGDIRGRDVGEQILSRLGPTLQLTVSSLLLSLLIGVPIGIYSAVRQYSRFDYIFTTIAFVGSSMPVFFFGLLLILLFSVTPNLLQNVYPWLPELPPGSNEAVRPYSIATWLPRIQPGTLVDQLLHLLMPLTVLTFVNVANWSRFVRSSMLEVLRQDYVRTARAKGLVERIVVSKHALRNALIPFVTILVLQIPGVFAGAILTETVFDWPGMGSLFVQALNDSEWPLALAFVLITALLTVIATLLGDILYTVVDPRIKYT